MRTVLDSRGTWLSSNWWVMRDSWGCCPPILQHNYQSGVTADPWKCSLRFTMLFSTIEYWVLSLLTPWDSFHCLIQNQPAILFVCNQVPTAIRVPSFVKFSLETREPGAGFGKAAIAKLIALVDQPLHSTCLVAVKRAIKNRTAAFINCSNGKKCVMYCWCT